MTGFCHSQSGIHIPGNEQPTKKGGVADQILSLTTEGPDVGGGGGGGGGNGGGGGGGGGSATAGVELNVNIEKGGGGDQVNYYYRSQN